MLFYFEVTAAKWLMLSCYRRKQLRVLKNSDRLLHFKPMFLDYLGIMTVFNLDNYSVLIHTKKNLPQRQDIHIHNSKNSNKPNLTEPETGQSCESSDLTEKPQKFMNYILWENIFKLRFIFTPKRTNKPSSNKNIIVDSKLRAPVRRKILCHFYTMGCT